MHTDEYEIALSREVDVSKSQVRKYQRHLATLEARHTMTTEDFLRHSRLGDLPAIPDLKEWQENIEALQRWNATLDEYERLLGIMKISAS